MIDAALPYLRCPNCAQPLTRSQQALRCARGHSFDLAKQGYADLSAGRLPHHGDSAPMVADRETFLAAGHYDFIADALAAAAPSGFLVDAGVGTGFYLARALGETPTPAPGETPTPAPGETPTPAPGETPTRALGETPTPAPGETPTRPLGETPTPAPGETSSGVGLDVSKPALRRAARAHPRAAAVLTDLWRPLPIVDGCAAAVLNVFAPRNGAEFRRVLRPDGVLLVVTPAAGHLRELVTAYGMIGVDPDKERRVRSSLDDFFLLKTTKNLKSQMRLNATEARTLIGMTPSAHHGAGAPTEDVTVTAEVTLNVYRPV
ncbi:23S rRNA methyltransferase [Actinoplanes sp. KI2]|uniref:putative RNA methyltransferase n=1 Tax=Actinoplanes sp. KI2 TaxID=2983315 RepID=UPI0021D58BA9|nr:23S rRNA methyltransferase [Actinoplanes sp. KI2]MCU7726743.1 23S rRNA methyltransferase [Actinoplanes sp. KI2]